MHRFIRRLALAAAVAAAAPGLAYEPNGAGRVHTYVIDGNDPFEWADVRCLAERLRGVGVGPVRYAKLREAAAVARELSDVQCADPCARVVVIGYSLGANKAAWVAAKPCRPIESVVYLDAVLLFDTATPRGVRRLVNVYSDRPLFRAPEIPGAEGVLLPKAGHYSVPRRDDVFALLAAELHGAAVQAPGR